ncbi:hypothetical protein ACFY1J_05170 [Streptomyces sp. NPDC001406]|uniref:hypothetical protein n=1 Tax=Streptomyces sp. NPDC001406 TaxID=3364572 RepID=UPI003678813A
MQLNRATALRLQQEGKTAYQAGDPGNASPYDRLGNAEQQFGYRYWMRGWSMARSEAEDAQAEPAASTGH